MKKILIAVQARSTSERFPGKIFETIGDKTVLQHVLSAAKTSGNYVNSHSIQSGLQCVVALLIPFGDEAKFKCGQIPVVEGPEDDVLQRYIIAQRIYDADYIVRITADCPLIPPPIISSLIYKATKNKTDYCSNVEEDIRTFADGMDCEVMSKKALEWLNENATSEYDKEHVTSLIRKEKPKLLKISHIVGFLNLKDIKLSIDTPEDLERVREQYEYIKKSVDKAREDGLTYRY